MRDNAHKVMLMSTLRRAYGMLFQIGTKELKGQLGHYRKYLGSRVWIAEQFIPKFSSCSKAYIC